ncbi:MAG: 1-acyl-sn-glycerol-3-phosphate acyltransferase [Christensenellaceae bacterium]|nr:1-acyl-sn-glycerol-3-phosphate acyltransferase [Christensenellaceae bacterium]
MKKNKDESTYAPRHPNTLLYWLLVPFAKFLGWIIFKVQVHKESAVKKLQGPFLALGTHSSPMDVAFMMSALMPHKLNVVCARDVFTWKPIKPIAKLAGLIPMSQFSMDIASVRLMKKAIAIGCNIAMFPEGKISLDGRQLHYISPSLAKFIKFLNVPVVMCHNNGGYSSRPKWFKGFKRGKIDQTVKLIFTKQEIESMAVSDIYSRLVDAFKYNDHIYQKENKIKFKSKTPALGLHYILYKCPNCGAEYQMCSTNTELICDACKNTIEYNEYGELLAAPPWRTPFERIDQWYDYQRATIREAILKEDFLESHPVVWEVNENNTYTESGSGELYIDRTNICFVGSDLSGNPVEIKYPLKTLSTIVQKTTEAVDLTIDGVVHRFYFREGKYSVKYTLIVEESYRHIHNLN